MAAPADIYVKEKRTCADYTDFATAFAPIKWQFDWWTCPSVVDPDIADSPLICVETSTRHDILDKWQFATLKIWEHAPKGSDQGVLLDTSTEVRVCQMHSRETMT